MQTIKKIALIVIFIFITPFISAGSMWYNGTLTANN